MLDRVKVDPVRLEYERIMECAAGSGNDETLACMLASWQQGRSALPDNFGFSADAFADMLVAHFPGLDCDSLCQPGRSTDATRSDEHEDVYRLLVGSRAGNSESEIRMAEIVARSCQGQDHLWQDMGLWSRNQLSELMMRNFPALASRNVNNMKWKKFIYKQLCVTEGIYTCRAPSCEVCVDYDNCFAPED
jgi:nitrogen fixation protein NifQ